MNSTSKVAPWIVSIVAVIVLIFIWQNSRSQIQAKNIEISTLKMQLQDANFKYNQFVNEANQRIQSASQPEVEATVSFRKALLYSGSVVVITNRSNQTIALQADIERPSSSQTKSLTITLDPASSKEIGEREGWAFIPQDQITLSQAGHKSIRVRLTQ